MSYVRNVTVSFGALSFCVALGACHNEPPAQPPPPPTITALPPPPPTDTAPPPPPPATAQPCDATMQLALQTAIKAREKSELGVGMKPESGYSCMVVPEGGSVTVPVTLAPGGCYAVIAQSFPNVSEVDLFLKPNFGPTPLPLLAPFAGQPLAQDSDTGPAATIGKGKNCYSYPLPIPGPVMVEAKARTGAGPIAVQIYSK
jgi:hypothetical protein